MGPGTDTLRKSYLQPVTWICYAIWAGPTIMTSLASRVNTAGSKGLELPPVDMIATSKGDITFTKLRAQTEPSEQEANVIMFPLATVPWGSSAWCYLVSFLAPHHCFLSLSEPETHLLDLATGKAWCLMGPV